MDFHLFASGERNFFLRDEERLSGSHSYGAMWHLCCKHWGCVYACRNWFLVYWMRIWFAGQAVETLVVILWLEFVFVFALVDAQRFKTRFSTARNVCDTDQNVQMPESSRAEATQPTQTVVKPHEMRRQKRKEHAGSDLRVQPFILSHFTSFLLLCCLAIDEAQQEGQSGFTILAALLSRLCLQIFTVDREQTRFEAKQRHSVTCIPQSGRKNTSFPLHIRASRRMSGGGGEKRGSRVMTMPWWGSCHAAGWLGTYIGCVVPHLGLLYTWGWKVFGHFAWWPIDLQWVAILVCLPVWL